MKTEKRVLEILDQNLPNGNMKDNKPVRPTNLRPRNLKVKKKKSQVPAQRQARVNSLVNSKNYQFKSNLPDTENLFSACHNENLADFEDGKASLTND